MQKKEKEKGIRAGITFPDDHFHFLRNFPPLRSHRSRRLHLGGMSSRKHISLLRRVPKQPPALNMLFRLIYADEVNPGKSHYPSLLRLIKSALITEEET